jgi:hypothetical protein
MTESQWYKSKNGDDLLSLVNDRLSERKWTLLACGVARRVLDLLPVEPHRKAVEHAERHAGEQTHFSVIENLAADLSRVEELTRAHQRTVVIACDPDAAELQFQETEGRRTNPAVPLFEAASNNAAESIEMAVTAVRLAHEAVRPLFAETGAVRLHHVRQSAIAAQVCAADAAIRAALALELKARGDETADRGQTRKPGLLLSEASDAAARLEDQAGYKIDRLNDQKLRGDMVALAHLVREQVGNPFRPYRFESSWRTETVLALAQAIEAERAFDRMPILTDALMDADCDEEAILRHCRGTEKHTKEPPHHAVGCWVLDLILGREPELFSTQPLDSRKRPMGRSQRLGPFTPPLEEMM